ncbi:endonuclease/exonuclease/phosphatase family protein [Allopontixanthobacter sp.]|uniref:endonuclease/exonuclease/phosphatase family protein n=1 Tax=Allopontixanthobacter sp. TaxID=2906452 RepID=UPI002AB97687|nr:endonuclease/exonuclease/phosphatase family protein [Allopontixanthobacter sp.]MDZ4307833.1 endonuclease/exonuclease/phosphatase family protein [Allopontixanthobacter sp.]
MLILIFFGTGIGATTVHARELVCAGPFLAMTYNIRLDTPADGANDWAHRREFLIAQIQLLRPAILGMQEVLPNQRSDLESALPAYSFVGGGRDDGKLAGEASPLAFDRRLFRIEKSGTFWLSQTPEVPSLGWDAAFRRVASWAHVSRKQDGARLLVINTHWDHVGEKARHESGKQLAGWIRANLHERESLVLLGDFNTGIETPAIADMIESEALVSANGADRALLPSPSQSSFNNYDPVPEPGKVIDHIFINNQVSVLRGMVMAQHSNGLVASDHFPVVALLDLPERRGKSSCE